MLNEKPSEEVSENWKTELVRVATMLDFQSDKNGKEITLQDYQATEVVGVQIGQFGHKLWICIDGVAVLRVRSPKIDLTDLRSLDQEQSE